MAKSRWQTCEASYRHTATSLKINVTDANWQVVCNVTKERGWHLPDALVVASKLPFVRLYTGFPPVFPPSSAADAVPWSLSHFVNLFVPIGNSWPNNIICTHSRRGLCVVSRHFSSPDISCGDTTVHRKISPLPFWSFSTKLRCIAPRIVCR